LKVADIKAAVRERDGHKCTECGMTAAQHIERHGRTLEVHRQEPGSPYSLDGCVTLCQGCHGSKPKTEWGMSPNIRLHPNLHAVLTDLAIARCSTVQAEGHFILLKALKAQGLYPPPSPSPPPAPAAESSRQSGSL
jgi:hypothetical protein